MSERVYQLPMDGIEIDDETVDELVRRMNKYWPGRYSVYRPRAIAINLYNPTVSSTEYEAQFGCWGPDEATL